MQDLYKFRVKDETNYYFISSLGTIATSPTPVDIISSVDSWEDMQLIWSRDDLFRGVFLKYAPNEFLFVNDIAKILRYLFNTSGNGEAILYLEVLRQKSTDLLYYPLGTFQIDFSKHKSKELYVEESLSEGGLTKMLSAYDTTDFAIPLLDPLLYPEFSYILMDGILLVGKYNYDMMVGSLGIEGNQGLTMPLVYIDQEGRLPFGIPNAGVVPATIWPGGDFDSAYHFKVSDGYEARVNFDIGYYIAAISPDVTSLEVWVEIRGKKPGVSVISNTHIGDFDISGGGGSTGVFTASTAYHTYSALENYIIIYFKCISSSGLGMTVVFDEYSGGVNIEYKHVPAQSVARSITHRELFKKLVGKISGNEATPPAKSDLLNTDVYPNDTVWNLNPYNTHFTCGDALRGLPTPEGIGIGDTEAELKLNFKDFLQDAFTSLCAGVGIEVIAGVETVVLEHLSHFFQKDVLLKDLGSNINDFQITLYENYRGNSIKAGYKAQTYDEVNGRYEFNAEAGFKTPVLRTLKDIDYQTNFRADCYGSEFTRINLEGKKTTDSSSDNDTFKLQSNGNTVDVAGYTPSPYQLERAHSITQGIPSEIADTVFNVPFTIQRNIRRMLPFISSNYYGLSSTTLSFETKSKNAAVVASMYGGVDVTERSNVDMTSADMLYKPFVFEFTSPTAIDLDEIMMVNPYGVFGLTVIRGQDSCYLEGFVLDVGLNPGKRQTYKYALLCGPDTDIPDWL